MTTTLVSAAAVSVAPAARPAAAPPRRRGLAARAAAQHAGRTPATLGRVVLGADTVPSASAFQSSL
ncbi:hypothetical protein [Streptomyces sp. NPDC048111]|uniref:hypothetical protein n=1 Tax=Streptomyces sp. NPDC048111 TaxID=3365500 RepID=UPI0037243182